MSIFPPMEQIHGAADDNKISHEIFSILERKLLFGDYDFIDGRNSSFAPPGTPVKPPATPSPAGNGDGRVRILSIDAGSGGLLAAGCLARLEASLRRRSGDPAACIADFFDLAAGSGEGGVLAAMLFTRGPYGRPLFTAGDALRFLAKNRGRFANRKVGILRALFGRRPRGIFRRIFGELTLRETLKPVLVTCYDLATGAPFVLSRADAMETESFDFRMSDVCAATVADPVAGAGAVEICSVDGRSRIVAVGGGLSLGNPASAAVTHVLNNRQEFPLAAGVDDLLVVSLGGVDPAVPGGGSGGGAASRGGWAATPSRAALVRIAGRGDADMVDQSLAMAFACHGTSNYLRIQANGGSSGGGILKSAVIDAAAVAGFVEEVLAERNVESVMFRGRKLSDRTNGELLEWFGAELVKEQEARRKSPSGDAAVVAIRQVVTPRTSCATTATSASSAAATSSSSSTSPPR